MSDFQLQFIDETPAYDDVWSRQTDMCGFCAYEVTKEDERCPRCKRQLIHKAYLYEETDINFSWLLYAMGAGIFLYGAGTMATLVAMRYLVEDPLLFSLYGVGLTFTIAYIVLGAGIFFRQHWAYLATVILTIPQFFVSFVPLAVLPKMASPSVIVLIGHALFLGYITFLAAPNFLKTEKQDIAQLKKGLVEADQFDLAAKEFARKKMWATAILHWQQAAKRKGQTTYWRRLAQAYATLGFYERSLEALDDAKVTASTPQVKQEIEQLIAQVKEKHIANG